MWRRVRDGQTIHVPDGVRMLYDDDIAIGEFDADANTWRQMRLRGFRDGLGPPDPAQNTPAPEKSLSIPKPSKPASWRSMTVEQLRELKKSEQGDILRSLDVSGRSKMNEDERVNAILSAIKGS